MRSPQLSCSASEGRAVEAALSVEHAGGRSMLRRHLGVGSRNPLKRRPRGHPFGVAHEGLFLRHYAEHHGPAERDTPQDIGGRHALA